MAELEKDENQGWQSNVPTSYADKSRVSFVEINRRVQQQRDAAQINDESRFTIEGKNDTLKSTHNVPLGFLNKVAKYINVPLKVLGEIAQPPQVAAPTLGYKDASGRTVWHKETRQWQPRLTRDSEELAEARLTGYLTRWQNLFPRRDFPVEAFEWFQDEEFAKWWWHNGGPSKIVDEISGLPEVVWHGATHAFNPKIGFVQQAGYNKPKFIKNFEENQGSSTQQSSGMFEIENGPHFGTFFQALDITWQRAQGDKNLVLPHRDQINTQAMKYFANNKEMPVPKSAKYYPGFIKMNNPLVLNKDILSWDFSNMLDSGLQEILKAKGYTYSQDSSELDFDDKGILYDGGSGTALEKIYQYAIEAAGKEGIELRHSRLDSSLQELAKEKQEHINNNALNKSSIDKHAGITSVYSDISLYPEPSAVLSQQLEFFRMKGLIKFIREDLGFDGIKYMNDVEDAQAPDWSYILFDPRQFKSLFNDGTFDTDDHDFLSENIPSKKGTNKYKVTA